MAAEWPPKARHLKMLCWRTLRWLRFTVQLSAQWPTLSELTSYKEEGVRVLARKRFQEELKEVAS